MPTRRHILKHSALGIALALAPRPFADAPNSFPIIDTHQHLWDLDRFRLPWLDRAGPLLKRNYLTGDYRKAIEGTGITAAVYMEVEVVPDQFTAEADSVIDLCRKRSSPTIGAVI